VFARDLGELLEVERAVDAIAEERLVADRARGDVEDLVGGDSAVSAAHAATVAAERSRRKPGVAREGGTFEIRHVLERVARHFV
jgi:hypothetical protein